MTTYCDACNFDYHQRHTCESPAECDCRMEICDRGDFFGSPRWTVGAEE